jgi:hypothetical protein
MHFGWLGTSFAWHQYQWICGGKTAFIPCGGRPCASARNDAVFCCFRRRQQSGKHEAFGQVESGWCFAGKHPGSSADTLEFSALAEQIQVGFKDLLFAPACFQSPCNPDLSPPALQQGTFSDSGHSRIEQGCELHGNGTGAAAASERQGVPNRADYASQVNTRMLPKAPILAIDNRFDKGRSNHVQRNPLEASHPIVMRTASRNSPFRSMRYASGGTHCAFTAVNSAMPGYGPRTGDAITAAIVTMPIPAMITDCLLPAVFLRLFSPP